MPDQEAPLSALGHIGQIDYTVIFARDLDAMRIFTKRSWNSRSRGP
ncbi:hypothetical protein [Neorhizobium sp. JUb45]|nr:hypothetical protein [Neorhizobium sp. JUb45]TCR04368.1 hypothetical protein EDF70_102467 [Neorhizobium sp. JUb45]